MIFIARFFCLIFICSAFFSCKNEGKSTAEDIDNDPQESVITPVPEKKELVKEVVDQENSVMLKSMITPELKTLSSMFVTTGLSDILSKKGGPFTIIGPSNDAFTSLGQLQMNDLLNAANEDKLVVLIKGHVVEESLDSATLVQKIKDGNGSYKIISMSGATYTASREGTEIVITDINGVVARLGKSDIKGANGVVHVVDKVLGVN